MKLIVSGGFGTKAKRTLTIGPSEFEGSSSNEEVFKKDAETIREFFTFLPIGTKGAFFEEVFRGETKPTKKLDAITPRRPETTEPWDFRTQVRYWCGRIIEDLAGGTGWRNSVHAAMDISERVGFTRGYNQAIDDFKAKLIEQGIEFNEPGTD